MIFSYAHRYDKLDRREYHWKDGFVHEFYRPGRSDRLKGTRILGGSILMTNIVHSIRDALYFGKEVRANNDLLSEISIGWSLETFIHR